MKNASGLVLVLLLSFAFAGCERKAESPAGFRLPDGNAASLRLKEFLFRFPVR